MNRRSLNRRNAARAAQQGEFERAIEELSVERDRIQHFHNFVLRLGGAPELPGLGSVMLEDLSAIAAADGGALFVADTRGGTDRLWLATATGISREQLPALLAPGEGPPGRAALERRTIAVSDGAAKLRLPALGPEIRARHELHLPIVQGDSVIGVISLARAGEDPFAADLVAELEQMMRSAAVGLANALSLRTIEDAARLNQAVLDSAHDAYIAIDETAVVEAWSPRATSLYGYTEEEALGRSLDELLLPEEARPEHRQRLARIVERTKQGGTHLERFEVWTRGRDGHRLLTEMSVAVVRGAGSPLIAYFARDITERERNERLRRAEEGVSRAVAEAEIAESVVEPILAALGEHLGWAYGAFWEYDEGARGLRCAQIWSGEWDEREDVERFSFGVTVDPTEASAGFRPVREAWKSGEPRWEELDDSQLISERLAAIRALGIRAVLMLPVHASEGILGVIEFGAVAAEQPDAAMLQHLRSITDLVGQVVERRRAVQEAERFKDEFFALVSHELRTPLTSVIGYLDIVRAGEAGEINEEQRRYLDVIDRNTQRLLRLVGDLLFVAQVEAGAFSLERGPVGLDSIVRASVEAARPRADKQGVLLAAEVDPITMESGDADRLGQLVDNLISNAVKFTPSGGSVSVRLRQMEEGHALLEVADTGMGIPAADQERLFERFYRADAAARGSFPGIGLGLPICRAIAEGHGGSIEVESEVGRGATFRVELPLVGGGVDPA